MDKELTDITVILDRSGSMSSVKGATIEGFNAFVRKQREATGRAKLTFVQFDDVYEVVYERRDITQVEYLTDETFVPRGGTALLDAVGRAVGTVEERLAKTAENDLPGKTIFLILTDGAENQSKEFTWPAIKALIERKRGKDSWEFVFVGANIDAEAVAAKMAIPSGNAMQYSSNTLGTRAAFEGMSRGLVDYRESEESLTSCYFSAEDKAAALAPDPGVSSIGSSLDPGALLKAAQPAVKIEPSTKLKTP